MGESDYKIPDRQLELFARLLLPEIKKFFANEDVKKEFELWQTKQKIDIEKSEK